MITTMLAIEYNTWMSLLWFISHNAPTIADQYGMDGTVIAVMPAYPKDLAGFVKPSIIVQKIHSKNHSVGMGGFLGQYLDEPNNSLYDIKGRVYEMTYQMDINGDSNTSCSLLTDLMLDIIHRASDQDDPIDMPLLNFLDDVNNPQPLGEISIMQDDDITPLSSNDNQDYINAMRIKLRVLQSIVGNGQMVDLSKPIKWHAINHMTQTIKL